MSALPPFVYVCVCVGGWGGGGGGGGIQQWPLKQFNSLGPQMFVQHLVQVNNKELFPLTKDQQHLHFMMSLCSLRYMGVLYNAHAPETHTYMSLVLNNLLSKQTRFRHQIQNLLHKHFIKLKEIHVFSMIVRYAHTPFVTKRIISWNPFYQHRLT